MSDELINNPEQYDPDQDPNALTEGDIIEMVGEDGETVSFIFVDALEYEGDVYLALAEPDEDDAVFFLKIEQDEDGNDVYNAPDEALEDILFARFTEMRSTKSNILHIRKKAETIWFQPFSSPAVLSSFLRPYLYLFFSAYMALSAIVINRSIVSSFFGTLA